MSLAGLVDQSLISSVEPCRHAVKARARASGLAVA